MTAAAEFHPAWWCQGPHAQTIWGALAPAARVPLRRHRWELPDGDFLDMDEGPAQPGAPVLIILHGLESSSRARGVLELLQAARACGWRGLGLNFRSCSGFPNRLRRSYHGGETGDLAWVIQQVMARHPGAPIVCIGFSLGGNVLLKYLAEQGSAAPVRAAAAISTPFDLAVSVQAIEQGISRLYMRRLVRQLTRKTWAKLAQFPDLVDRQALRTVRTMSAFDDLVTAPINGFPGAAAYWAAASSGPTLSRIATPTLLINALDDPFFPGAALPREGIAQNPNLSAEFPRAGGHMGFVAGPWPGRSWAAGRSIAFFHGVLDGA